MASSASVPTSGIMISGTAWTLLLSHSIAASTMARHLHLQDLGVGHAQAAAAVAQHRVGFLVHGHPAADRRDVRRIDHELSATSGMAASRRAGGTRAAGGRAGGPSPASPCIAVKMPMKSSRWKGSSFLLRPPRRWASSSATIISRMASDTLATRRTCARCGTGRCP
jgi:hypothetical protein